MSTDHDNHYLNGSELLRSIYGIGMEWNGNHFPIHKLFAAKLLDTLTRSYVEVAGLAWDACTTHSFVLLRDTNMRFSIFSNHSATQFEYFY